MTLISEWAQRWGIPPEAIADLQQTLVTQTPDPKTQLREAIAWWGGYQRAAGRPDAESYRRFWFAFGTDVLSAQALGTKEAQELTGRINSHLQEMK